LPELDWALTELFHVVFMGYVVVPCCPVIFNGANYAEFVAFMRITCMVFNYGAFSHVCRALLLLWLLSRQVHRFLMLMLPK
jgi:hypothetical protein